MLTTSRRVQSYTLNRQSSKLTLERYKEAQMRIDLDNGKGDRRGSGTLARRARSLAEPAFSKYRGPELAVDGELPWRWKPASGGGAESAHALLSPRRVRRAMSVAYNHRAHAWCDMWAHHQLATDASRLSAKSLG